MNERLPGRDVVLVGAGHTNMHVVRMWRMKPIPDARLTLVSPFSRATYSGMLPGTLAGLYEPDEMAIDLYRFAVPFGVRVIIADAEGVDAQRRRVFFNDRPPIRFDVASIGIGSVPAGAEEWSNCPEVLPIKPMATFQTRLDEHLHALRSKQSSDNSAQPVRVCITGGGAAGVEVAFCLQARLNKQGVQAEYLLIDSRETVLSGYLPGTIRKVTETLRQRGIRVLNQRRVTSIQDGRIGFADGGSETADLVVWVTGAEAPPLLSSIDLPKDDAGFLAVNSTLQSTADLPVFAVGDSAALVETPVRKSGVYAVREGPFLWDNLQRFVSGRELKAYDPQSGFNSMLADGEGRAFVDYKRFSLFGGWCWNLKDRIDRKFMRMYQDYRPMPAGMSDTLPAEVEARPVMKCRGCGGKAGAGVLHAAFERLAAQFPQTRHRAFDGAEDAAHLKPAQEPTELVSVDFFQPFLDDPWIVGRIAALNSLSDIWASGGRTFGALATVQLPEGMPNQQAELLFQLLAGSLFEFDLAGVELLGGHTTEASELTIGFTVLGALDGNPTLKKEGLTPGDSLILTKPLGTGVLLAGIPQALTRGEWVDDLLKSMLQANRDPAAIASRYDVSALTDVTGFGLAGHLLEMLEASGVDATVSLGELPCLSGFEELASAGMESTLAPSNREVESRLGVIDEAVKTTPRYSALFDPQTSGGLLIGVSTELAAGLRNSLSNAGIGAFEIGSVTDRSDNPTIIVER